MRIFAHEGKLGTKVLNAICDRICERATDAFKLQGIQDGQSLLVHAAARSRVTSLGLWYAEQLSGERFAC